MDDSFSALARKIRSKKLNKEDIENLKKEAIESKIERNRRQKKAIEIQRIIRGYLARKKFKILEDKINIDTIIDYLYEKKLKRIHKHSSQIISYFIYKYIERQRKIKNKLINEYKIHCSDLIKAFIRGIILRNKIKDEIELIRNNKKILEPYFLSFRTRLMLKCTSIQNILSDIANIKFLLQDEEQNQSEEGKQGIKELKMKLRKKYNEFYLIFYQNKMTSEWVDEERTPEPWLKKYQKILNGEDVTFMKKNNISENVENNSNYNNNNSNSKQVKGKSQRKMRNVDNNEYIEEEYLNNNNNNYDNNYIEDESSNNNILNAKIQNIHQGQKVYKEDDRPIKPMKNNNFMNSENPFGLSKKGFPEDHINNNNNNNYISQRNAQSQKSKIKRNAKNGNTSNKKLNNISNNNYPESQYNQNEEESKSQSQYQDIQKFIKYQDIQNIRNINNIQYNDYDERPIGKKKIDYNAMFAEGQNFEGDGFGGMNQEININPNQRKIIKNKNSPRKKPVYDARKAIEEAKLREAKEGKKEKPSAFREFVKEMKKISAEEKAGQVSNNENSPKNKNSSKTNVIPKVKNYGKDDLSIKQNNYIEDDNNNYNNNNVNNEEQANQEQRSKRIPIKSRRVETKDMIMRRKLHELERSPPPVLNIKGAKSKIECWGPSNEVKRQRITQYNNEKEKKMKNISKKNNYQTESKDSMNINSVNKKSIEVNQNKINKVVDPKKIEEKAKKIALKKLSRIENQINRIESEFNLDNYFKNKERKMMEFGKIPYIKKEYNYVKKYSNEVYTSLVTHLMTQFQELK